jgi:hypothetical protein
MLDYRSTEKYAEHSMSDSPPGKKSVQRKPVLSISVSDRVNRIVTEWAKNEEQSISALGAYLISKAIDQSRQDGSMPEEIRDL